MNNNIGNNGPSSKVLKPSRGLLALNSILKNPIHNIDQLKEKNDKPRNKDINNKNNDENNKALINKTKHQIESLNSRSFIMNQDKKIDV